MADQWWRQAVFYHVYPRSFCDASGDGVGDLKGVRHHLDHLVWLGVDALWLSPFYRSPMADFGYDVSDYTDVDPLFGTLDDFVHLLADAHQKDLRVIVDWVPNHTSDQHPWFVESRSSRDCPKRDWYWWRDDRPDSEGGSGPPGSEGRRPNNWRAAFTGVGRNEFPPAWTWDPGSEQWYLHMFLDHQPDLNWNHPDVRQAMADTARFWLDLGVDGFRIDAIHCLGKDPALPDLPADVAAIPACVLTDHPSVHPLLAELRRVLERYSGPRRLMLGETFLPSVEQIAPYYGTATDPELDLAFNFVPLRSRWEAPSWRRRVDETDQLIRSAPETAWPSWVLSNHDNPRHRTRYGGSEAKARAAAVLLLTLPGTPFLYAGEELGLEDAVIPPDRQVDPGGRDGCRAPIPWDATASHGWMGGADAWLPWPPEADSGRTVAEEAADTSSTLHLYRNLVTLRKACPALREGTFTWVETTEALISYVRAAGDQSRLVAINFTSEPAATSIDGSWEIELSSDPRRRPGQVAVAFELGPDEAVILRRPRPPAPA